MAEPAACYWDASAILSVLVEDEHTRTARAYLAGPRLHLVSSLAYAETAAVLHRIERQGILAQPRVKRLLDGLDGGPWRHLRAAPSRKWLKSLHDRHPLRGADLWHLALLITLSRENYTVTLASYDKRLNEAANAEGIQLAGAS